MRQPVRVKIVGIEWISQGAGGGWVNAAQVHHAISFTCLRSFASSEDQKGEMLCEDFRMFPARERLPLVVSHQPEPLCVGSKSKKVLQGLIAIRRRRLSGFPILDLHPWLGHGKSQHRQTIFCAGLGGRCFVRRLLARQKEDGIEFRLLMSEPCDVKMPFVNRVEGAAKKCDARARFHDEALASNSRLDTLRHSATK